MDPGPGMHNKITTSHVAKVDSAQMRPIATHSKVVMKYCDTGSSHSIYLHVCACALDVYRF